MFSKKIIKLLKKNKNYKSLIIQNKAKNNFKVGNPRCRLLHQVSKRLDQVQQTELT